MDIKASDDIHEVRDEAGVAPCRNSCPARIGISESLALVAEGKLKEAWQQLTENNPFPAITGRVCPCYCETRCNRGKFDEALAIKSLERFLGDYGHNEALTPKKIAPVKPNKVAIMGAGPAGLSAAYYLTNLGYPVTLFEASSRAGGMLYWGVPEHRLPKKVLDEEIAALKQRGAEIRTGSPFGKGLTLKNLSSWGYEAVVIAIGAQRDLKLNIAGEDAEGVVPGIEFLRKVNSGKDVTSGNAVLVIGGGNTAVDAARVSARLGAGHVTILYRRSRKEMPAINEEVEAASKDGVEIQFLVSPTEVIVKDGRVAGLKCVRVRLGEPDAEGRRIPKPVPGSEFSLGADTVIVAVGQVPDKSLLSRLGVKINAEGIATNLPHVFVAGDVNQAEGGTVIQAIAAGRKAALGIHSEISGGELPALGLEWEFNYQDVSYFEQTKRREVKGSRIKALVNAAMAESSRCFHCGKAWIEVQENWCKACGLCVEACKLGLIGYSDGLNPHGFHAVKLSEPDKCCGCTACALVCPDMVIEVCRQK